MISDESNTTVFFFHMTQISLRSYYICLPPGRSGQGWQEPQPVALQGPFTECQMVMSIVIVTSKPRLNQQR